MQHTLNDGVFAYACESREQCTFVLWKSSQIEMVHARILFWEIGTKNARVCEYLRNFAISLAHGHPLAQLHDDERARKYVDLAIVRCGSEQNFRRSIPEGDDRGCHSASIRMRHQAHVADPQSAIVVHEYVSRF